MKFKCSTLKPEQKDPIEQGLKSEGEVLDFVKSYNWRNELMRMKQMNDRDIHYSPSMCDPGKRN